MFFVFVFLHYFAVRIIDPDHVNIYVHLLLVNCTQPKKFIAALQRVAEQTYNSIFTVQQMRQIAQVSYSSFKTTLTNANFCSSEIDFHIGKRIVPRGKIMGTKKTRKHQFSLHTEYP